MRVCATVSKLPSRRKARRTSTSRRKCIVDVRGWLGERRA
jgi:hypothetical protein